MLSVIDVALARLGPGDLRNVAGDLALDRATAIAAARGVLSWRPVDEPAQQRIQGLASRDWRSWTPKEVTVLRRALRLHLADICDAVLWVSQAERVALQWDQLASGDLEATLVVPDMAAMVEASITEDLPGHGEQAPATGDLFADAGMHVGPRLVWSVVWYPAVGAPRPEGSGVEGSLQAARFGAEVAAQSLLSDTAALRRLAGL
jgi:hypothetical protein